MTEPLYDVIILGSGPAGLTAALYAGRANLKTLVVSGVLAGGQLMLTTMVENFPGFPEGLLGPDMMGLMRKQAERFGAEFVDDDATSVNFKKNPFKVMVGEKAFEGRSVIIATGASAKWLGLESEARLRGRGISSCATCDAYFFKEKEVVVVGGGDTAMEEALFLTKFATHITVMHRRDRLRASKIMQDRGLKHPKISFVWNTVVEEVLGKDKVEGVRVKDIITGEEKVVPCDGVFIAIGYEPKTDLFKGQVEMDEKGYIVIKGDEAMQTSVTGVFAAGDVHDHRYRQAITAAGDGCRAAMDAERYLEEGKGHGG